MIGKANRTVKTAVIGLILAVLSWGSFSWAYQQIGNLHWADADIPVPYKINSSQGPSGASSASRTSFGTWQGVSGSYLSFSYRGSTSSQNVGYDDGQNICAFLTAWSWGKSAIAVCSIWYDPSNGAMADADIGFNARDFTWATNGSPKDMDVQNIATHEIGHFCGLDDLYSGADSAKTMYGYSTEGETKKRSLDPDDIAGVSAIYPVSGPSPQPGPSPSPSPSPEPPQLNSLTLSDKTDGSTSLTDEREINVSISAEKSPTAMVLSENSDFSGADWSSYSSSAAFTLSESVGGKTVYCRLRNDAGQSEVKSAGITYAPLPVLNSVVLSDKTSGSTEYTDSREVNVTISAAGAPTEVNLAPYPDLSGGGWVSYNSGLTYTLSEGDGTKTVYCRLRDNYGRESETKSASVVLDTQPPVVSLLLEDVGLRAGDFLPPRPTVKGSFSESNGIKTDTIEIKDNGAAVADGAAAGGRYDNYDETTRTATYTFKSDLANGSHAIAISVADLAGNTGSAEVANLAVSNTLALESVMNFPNPFSAATEFSYQLSCSADIVIKIYTLRGELARTLTAAAGESGGEVGFNKIAWDGTDQTGRQLANGLYLYIVCATDSEGNRAVKRSKAGVLR